MKIEIDFNCQQKNPSACFLPSGKQVRASAHTPLLEMEPHRSFENLIDSTEAHFRGILEVASSASDETGETQLVNLAALAGLAATQGGGDPLLGDPHQFGEDKKTKHQKRYRSTDKGKAAQRKAQEKYRRSDKGKVAQTKARRKWRENHRSQDDLLDVDSATAAT